MSTGTPIRLLLVTGLLAACVPQVAADQTPPLRATGRSADAASAYACRVEPVQMPDTEGGLPIASLAARKAAQLRASVSAAPPDRLPGRVHQQVLISDTGDYWRLVPYLAELEPDRGAPPPIAQRSRPEEPELSQPELESGPVREGSPREFELAVPGPVAVVLVVAGLLLFWLPIRGK